MNNERRPKRLSKFLRNYWDGMVELRDDPRSVRINGQHFMIAPENQGGPRGMGGERVNVVFTDGRNVSTSNLWSQGEIPDEYRDRLPDNVTALEQAPPPLRAPVEQGEAGGGWREHLQARIDDEFPQYVPPPGTSEVDPAREMQDRREAAWRAMCGVAYSIVVRDYGNDGRPEDDLPTAPLEHELTVRADELARDVGVSADRLRATAREAAWRHGQDPGSDDDPDRFAAPVWDELRAEEAAERRQGRDEPPEPRAPGIGLL